MSRTVTLHVFPVPGDDPDALLAIPRASFAARSVRTRAWPLVADPPPDTMFMRASGLDLSVFGDDFAGGSLQMIDGASLVGAMGRLRAAIDARFDETVADLGRLGRTGRRPVDDAAIARALKTGEWPPAPDAILQAAAFARQLLDAGAFALPLGASLVWTYEGGAPSYGWP